MLLHFITQVQELSYLQDVSYKMAIETYTTIDGIDCVTWTDEQGTHSMTKEAYDLSQVEHLTEIIPTDEA